MHDAPRALSSSCDACPATGGGPWARGVADRGHDAPLGVMASPCKTAARGMVAASLTRAKEWSGVVLIVIVLVGLPRLFAAWFALGQRLTNYLASLVQVNVTGRLEVPIIAAWQQELHEQILPVWVSIWSPTAAAWAWLNLSAGGLLALLWRDRRQERGYQRERYPCLGMSAHPAPLVKTEHAKAVLTPPRVGRLIATGLTYALLSAAYRA